MCDFGELRVIPGRGTFMKGKSLDPRLYLFDKFLPQHFSPSFIKLVQNSHFVEDPKLLQNIYSEREKYTETISHEIKNILALNSVILETDPIFLDHFTVLQQIYSKITKGELYSIDNLYKDTKKKEFSFLSMDIVSKLEKIQETFAKPIVVLYYTQLGFMRLHTKNISFQDAFFVIVISKTEAFIPQNGRIDLHIPSPVYHECRSGIFMYHLISFSLFDGIYHPIIEDESFCNYVTNKSGFVTRTDGLSFPVDSIGLRTQGILGMFGRYSVVQRHLQHFKIAINASDLNDATPFIGIYVPKNGFNYMFLYLPNDLPPSHPSFADISSFAYAFMRKTCTRVLCFTEPLPIPTKNNFSISGLFKQRISGKIRFLGSGKNSLIMKDELKLIIGKNGRDSLVFSGADEVLMWRKWVGRQYIPRIYKKKQYENYLPIDIKQIVILMKGDSRSSLESVINSISSLSEIDKKIGNAYSNHSDNLVELVNKKMETFNAIFVLCARIVSTAIILKKSVCKFCKKELKDKAEIHSTEWCSMCPKCQLMKIKDHNNKEPSNAIPTQYLEDEVEDTEHNRKDFEKGINRLKEYFLAIETKGIVLWFMEMYVNQCLKLNRDELKRENFNDVSIEVFKDNMSPESFRDFISNLVYKSFNSGVDYFASLVDIAARIPIKMSAEEIRTKYIKYYMDNEVPKLVREERITEEKWKELCNTELERVVNSGIEKDYAIEIGTVSSLPDGTLDVEFQWNNDQKIESISRDYTFSEIVDTSRISYNFSARPASSKEVFSLYSQPKALKILNAFHVENKSVIATKMGETLWINVVPDNYRSCFLGDPLINIAINKDDEPQISYSSVANILIISYSNKKNSYIETYKLSRDLYEAVKVAERPLNNILPVSSANDFTAKLLGICLDESGEFGLLTSNYCYFDSEPKYAILKFDPMTLMCISREDKFDLPLTPIYSGKGKSYYHSPKECRHKPLNSVIIAADVNKEDIRASVGVIDWRDKACVVKSIPNAEPIILTNEEDNEEMKLSLTPNDCIDLLAHCINEFGLGETDRLGSGNDSYNINSVSVETVFDLKGNKVNEYFHHGIDTSKKIFGKIGGSLITTAHKNPTGDQSIIELEEKTPPKESQKRSFFPLVSQMLGGVRFLVNGEMPSIMQKESEQSMPNSYYEKSFIRRLRNMDTVTFLREMIALPHPTVTLSVVNCGCDGSNLISSISSNLFLPAPPCSVRLSTSFIQKSWNKFNKFDDYISVNSISFAPADVNNSSSCAVSFIHALIIGGIVVLYAEDLNFVIKVIREAKSSMASLKEIYPQTINSHANIVVCCPVDDNTAFVQNKLMDAVNISQAGDDETFDNIIKEISIVPSELGNFKCAKIIAEMLESNTDDISKSVERIVFSAASYGALNDNKQFFLE